MDYKCRPVAKIQRSTMQDGVEVSAHPKVQYQKVKPNPKNIYHKICLQGASV